jgi:threonine dehydrogenase-like Zn-dependent dehydrogenase
MPRRLAITGLYQVEILEYQNPPLKPNDVLVETELASGKHGTTFAMMDGRAFRGQNFDQSLRLFVETEAKPADVAFSPWGTGTTGVGTVVEAGPLVTRWKPGDRVFGFMDVREFNTVPEGSLWALGEIDPCLALCLEPAYVAFHCVRESQVRYGESVAVYGLGALGLLAVNMAAMGGAEMVIAVDPLEKRRQWALDHGADYAVDPTQTDPALEIHRLLGGPGVDVAIELAGNYSALNTAIRSVRVAGTVCSAGFYQDEARGMWLGREWHHNRINVIVPHGCGWGHPPRDYPRWDKARADNAIVSLMRKGKLAADGLIDPIVGLQEGPEVFRLMEKDPGKVIKFAVHF